MAVWHLKFLCARQAWPAALSFITVLLFALQAPVVQAEEVGKQGGATALAAEAREHRIHHRLGVCGRTFLRAADLDPDPEDKAIFLHEAGLCFLDGRDFGQAVAAHERLLKEHPESRVIPETIYALAAANEWLADYAQAAELLEKLARDFPYDWLASRALRRASLLRVDLQQFDDAIADITSYGNRYGKTHEDVAASLGLHLAEIYERQERIPVLAKHLKNYLRRQSLGENLYGRIRAHFKLGEIAWKMSCPIPGAEGGCVSASLGPSSLRDQIFFDLEEQPDTPEGFHRPLEKYCSVFQRSVTTPIRRDPFLAAEAQMHFNRSLQLWDRAMWEALSRGLLLSGQDAPSEDAARFAAAGAAFYRAEQRYEAFLQIQIPDKLYFVPPPQVGNEDLWDRKFNNSAKSLQAYWDKKSKLLSSLAGPGPSRKGLYDLVLDFHVPYWTVAAAARIAQVFANPAHQVYGITIPDYLTMEADEWGNRVRARFCESATRGAERFKNEAAIGYDLCLKAAATETLSNEWSELCRSKLSQLRPGEPQIQAEWVPEPVVNPPLFMPAALMWLQPDSEDPTVD